MARSTVHYADNDTNRILKKLHNKLRPAGTPVQRVEYIIELLLLRIFEVKLKQEDEFKQLRKLFAGDEEKKLFSFLLSVSNENIISHLNQTIFPFYSKIISEARTVYKGNFPPKVQDQLVLIEEVFSNPNFTNNVTSGNIAEIIGLVQELDESRLLKTDLLGDAIESSLSESGGTKDIGLYRTPDHIRQFMVGLTKPNFNDIIFDPACGTGGFLFDSFEFVMQRVKASYKEFDKWPGLKAHPELQTWFNNYFADNSLPIPSEDIAHNFYRNGISGFEYLGMVRKMAAINFYIRGLNPHNIQQGDSLAKFNPVEDKDSKSIVIANPPFGAERDQEAYPEVWSDYSRESETTILFVKLMFEHLKKGGTCATIVSEGFHSWDQFSAKALRKMLLDEADLKAVISLPQGVFVSKNGQGPKTSILLFEKGKPTENVWFFKVTNDGYTMGTNRKQTAGCQLVECLDLYHNYIKQGNQLPVSKHSFLIPAKWIKALDPRIKEKIRKETREELTLKGKEQKAKLENDLNKKLEASKIDKQEIARQLLQFDEILESKIENEIASRIEKAHTYSFNLSNYKSNLNDDELQTWKDIFNGINGNTNLLLDEIYHHLSHDIPEEALKYLSLLDPSNSMELDIAREYLFRMQEELINRKPKLAELKKVLQREKKYSLEKLENLLTPKYEKIKKDDYNGDLEIVEKISFSDGLLHFRDEKETGMDLYKADKGDLVTSKINVHQGAIAIAPKDLVCSTHYQVYSINKNDVLPEYLVYLLRTNKFLDQLNELKNKGIKNEQGADFYLSHFIPLPSIEEQQEIFEQLEKQYAIMEGANKILNGWEINLIDFMGGSELQLLGNAVIETKNGWSPVCKGSKQAVLSISCLQNGIIDFNAVKFTDEERTDISNYFVKEGDFFYSRGNTKELVALAAVAKAPKGNIVFPDLLTRVKFNTHMILPEFAVLCFNSELGRKYFGSVPEGSSPTMVKVSQDYMMNFKVPYIGAIEIQQKILAEIKIQMRLLDDLQKMKVNSQQKITKILSQVWGEENIP